MRSSNLFLGTFNTENYWRPENLAGLPSFADPEALNIIAALDELQFTFSTTASDLLITRYPFDKNLKEFLRSIGFDFICNDEPIALLPGESLEGGLARSAADGALQMKTKTLLQTPRNFSPYSILPDTTRFCSSYQLPTRWPDIDDVIRVNSKTYSLELSQEFLFLNRGWHCTSANEVLVTGERILREEGTFLIKDPFGVSGKGNMLIESTDTLTRIVNSLSRQEATTGKAVSMVLEPLLPKKLDFSCIFNISREGEVDILATQQVINNGFAYLGTSALGVPVFRLLEQSGYFDKITQIAKRLHRDKYHGPVCIDSMVLENNDVVPVIEINARKSMGYINYHLKKAFQRFGKETFVMNLPLIVPADFQYETLLAELDQHLVLFRSSSCEGVIPLSANTMMINCRLNQKERNLGRLYFAVVADSQDRLASYVPKLISVLGSQRVKVMNEKQILSHIAQHTPVL